MFTTQLLLESWNILKESAVFVLVGFSLAGVLHVVLAKWHWADWLKGLGARSVFLASAIGLPLPLCSCSVLPAAISLRKQGAGKGGTLSFLISTPETSVQSVLLTYALLGPVMAIYRPIAACVTAIVAGLVENSIEKRFPSPSPEPADTASADCCSKDGNSDPTSPASVGWSAGFRHAFVEVFDDVMGWMLIGIVVGAAIYVAVPGVVIQSVFGGSFQAMLIMLVIGIPLYVCAESSTPIAAALIAQGVSPGAALVFLLAGPATNLGAVGVLNKQLGRRTVIIYLTSIAVISIFMGLSLDWFFGMKGIQLSERVLAEPLVPEWIKTGGAIVFLLLSFASMIRLKYPGRLVSLLDRLLPVRVTRARLMVVIVAALVGGYVGSGFFTIQPGQVGMVKRFGAVIRHDVLPGLHYRLPFPVDTVDRIDTRRVFRTDLGYTSGGSDGALAGDETTSWVLLGDENIANIKCVTHWHMRQGQTRMFAYGAADRERAVRNAVQAALRSVLGKTDIETVFTTDQRTLATEIHEQVQDILNRYACGIEIMSFGFVDLHAPSEVHDAFRDIASALEDKDTRRSQALRDKTRSELIARGNGERMILEARGYEVRTMAQATGEASRFLQTLEAFDEYPDLTRTRLILEMYDRVFPGLWKCIKPDTKNLYLDLRFGGKPRQQELAF